MELCLGELHLDWCIIYLDDIIIFSKEPDEHITRLEGIFEKLAKAGLKLKPSKCEFFHSSLKYLGHIVSKEGIATDPRKIEAICNWPHPQTVTDVRSFTGFTNYYRKFIKGYAKIARPLHELNTDNNPLTYILSTAKLDAIGNRWVASLGPYNFALHYKPGKLNCDADALSRINWESVSPVVVQATLDLAHVDRTLILDPEVKGQKSADEPFVLKSLRINETIRKWQRRQKEDPEIRKIIELMHNNDWSTYKYSKNEPSSMKSYVKVRADLELENGLLHRRIRLKDHEVDTYQLVVPVAYRKTTLELLHDKFGHLGIDRTTGLSCERFFWSRMAEEIRQYIQNCERCLRYKQQPEWAELKPLEASYPLELVHMDYLKIGGKDDPNSNVLVITDHFTRFSQAYVTVNQQAATAARVFVREFVNNYGWPTKILTDQGQTFNGKLFTALCKEAKILKLRTSPYHPQTNGQPERFNRMLMTMLGTLPEDKKINWQDWVSTLCHAYNCTVTKVTGYSPYFLMFGHQPRIPVDEVFDVTFPKTNRSTMKQYVQTLQKHLEWAFEIAKEHIEKEVGRRKLYYDRKVHCMDIIPGDIVLVRQKVFGTQYKIEDRWELPVYKVLEQCGDDPLYKVQKIGGTEGEDLRVLHRNMLYPFIGIREEENDISVEEVSCLPEKSLIGSHAAALECANYFMDTYFDEDLV